MTPEDTDRQIYMLLQRAAQEMEAAWRGWIASVMHPGLDNTAPYYLVSAREFLHRAERVTRGHSDEQSEPWGQVPEFGPEPRPHSRPPSRPYRR